LSLCGFLLAAVAADCCVLFDQGETCEKQHQQQREQQQRLEKASHVDIK